MNHRDLSRAMINDTRRISRVVLPSADSNVTFRIARRRTWIRTEALEATGSCDVRRSFLRARVFREVSTCRLSSVYLPAVAVIIIIDSRRVEVRFPSILLARVAPPIADVDRIEIAARSSASRRWQPWPNFDLQSEFDPRPRYGAV